MLHMKHFFIYNAAMKNFLLESVSELAFIAVAILWLWVLYSELTESKNRLGCLHTFIRIILLLVLTVVAAYIVRYKNSI